MAFFLMLCRDRPGAAPVRATHRQRPVDYWLGIPGAVKVAGAIMDGDQPIGSSILIEAADETTARQLVAGDPFTTEGVFADPPEAIAVRPAIGAWIPAS
jgi:uncharacterized protein YciI